MKTIEIRVPEGFTGNKLAKFKKDHKESINNLPAGAHHIGKVIVLVTMIEQPTTKKTIELYLPIGMMGEDLKEWKLRNNWAETKQSILESGQSQMVDGVYCFITTRIVEPKKRRGA